MRALLPLCLALLCAPAAAGMREVADPDEVAAHVRGADLQLRGMRASLRGARWLGVAGRSRPAGPALPQRLPPGAWTDLALSLDGPVTLQLDGPRGPVTWTLDLGSEWDVALTDPELSGTVALSLNLPAWAAAVGDLTPDHPLHDALAAALKEGARIETTSAVFEFN